MSKVLVVGNKAMKRSALSNTLRKSGHDVKEADSVATAVVNIADFKPEVVLIAPNFEIDQGLELAVAMGKQPIRPELVLLMAKGTVEIVVKFYRLGAYDCILKPFTNEEIILLVQRAAGKYQLLREEG